MTTGRLLFYRTVCSSVQGKIENTVFSINSKMATDTHMYFTVVLLSLPHVRETKG